MRTTQAGPHGHDAPLTSAPSSGSASPSASISAPPPEPSGATAGRVTRPRDWAWRARIRANPQSRRIYRIVVATLGLVIVVAGLGLVPLPGPGWLIVFVGVSIWASEFHWAQRLHRYGMERLVRWNAWVMQQSLWVRGGIFLLTCLFVNAVLWVSLRITGIPGWMPDVVTSFLQTHLGL